MAEPGIQLANMTWPEARDALAAAEVVIVPTGSIEQHGPGMVLRTDTTIAVAVAERVADRLRPRAVVAPALPFGLSAHHLRFPGTLTLRPDTFMAVVLDLVRSLEASVALAAAPDLVRPEALSPGAELTPPYRHAVLAGGGAGAGAFVDAGLRMDELTANGALGDPRLASREAGEAVLRLVEDRLVEFLEDFMAAKRDPE